ncbi:flagellar hook-basal body complex protein [Thiovibrio sp. JS02]
MNLLGSFYNGISGVNAMGQKLNVTANNVANVNTNAFKAGQTQFADILETTINDLSFGHGVQLGNIGTSFSAGSLESTSKSTDMAINGAGFFLLRDPEDTTAATYSRSGNFNLVEHSGAEPNAYNLVTPTGQFVQGYNLSASTSPSTVIDDILIKSTSPQSATGHVELITNLDSDPALQEAASVSLFESWDGRTSPPIAADNYDYKSSIKIYGPGKETDPITAPSYAYDLTIYFDGTSNANEKEFLITCDPLLDQRLTDGGGRYSSAADKGAGALLYGVLHFTSNGDLSDIQCWDVPPDGNVAPSDTNQISLGRGESFFSFDYNFDPSGANNSSTISFGNTPKPQATTSIGGAYRDETAAEPISATTNWNTVFDSLGNQVQEGDIIHFQGSTGEGNPVSYSYTVNFSQTVSDLLAGLEEQFACQATISNGKLTLTDTEVGESRLAIDSISYSNSAGETPATNPDLAQIFGNQDSAFVVDTENRYYGGGLATTSYATPSTTISQDQNGYGKGRLQDIYLDSRGVIIGQYSNGQNLDQAQLVLANFTNQQGLRAEGNNSFVATAEAGSVVLGTSGQGSFGTVTNNSLEMSNVDLGREMVDIITTQRAFQANAKSISTTDEIYEKLLQMVR